jgi:chromosome segregation ATPase
LQARQDEVDRQLEPWVKEREKQNDKFWETTNKMMAFAMKHFAEDDLKDLTHTTGSFLDLFDLYAARHRTQLEHDIKSKEKELSDKLDAFAELPKSARKTAGDKLEILAQEVESLKAELQPLSEQARAAYNETKRLSTDLQRAKDALNRKSNRAKVEDLYRVIKSITCHFKHTDGRGRNPGYQLVNVTIEPVVATGLPTKAYDTEDDGIRPVGCSFATQKTRTSP